MPDSVLTSREHIDAGWLTRALHESGALVDGAVITVDVEPVGGTWSHVLRLRPAYDASARGECPRSLLLKICAGDGGVFGPSEVHYYTRDYRAAAGAPVPRCHHAAYRDQPRGYHLLLEDLSATHTTLWDEPPALPRACAIADAVARLHAVHWGAAGLAAIGAAPAGAAEVARYCGHVWGGLAPLLAIAGDDLPPAWRAALDATSQHLERTMVARGERDDGLALLHGDVNPGNVLAPRATPGGPVYLIDRQPFAWSLQAWIGAWDLAYPMVLFWEPDARRRLQDAVLEQYRGSLARAGIELSRDRFRDDYRLAILQCLAHAVEWLVVPEDRIAKRWLWEMQLGRAMDAYLELDCGALLG